MCGVLSRSRSLAALFLATSDVTSKFADNRWKIYIIEAGRKNRVLFGIINKYNSNECFVVVEMEDIYYSKQNLFLFPLKIKYDDFHWLVYWHTKIYMSLNLVITWLWLLNSTIAIIMSMQLT